MRLTLVSKPDTAQPADRGFTSRDLIALTCWMQQADAHGYRRVLIERGSGKTGPENGGYMLIYAPGSDWATWGWRGSVRASSCGNAAMAGTSGNLRR